jgi:conjugal transfer ATP-binding protein TraC
MIKALSTLGEKIVGFLGERVNYGTATDAPSRKLINQYLGNFSFATLLPYQGYDAAKGLFYNEGSLGFVLETSPLIGCTEAMQRELSGLFQHTLPEGSSLQFLLWADPRIGGVLQNWGNARSGSRDIFQMLAHKRIAFLNQNVFGQEQKLSQQLSQHLPIRNFRCIVAYGQPGFSLNPVEEQKLLQLKEHVTTALKTLGMPVLTWHADDLLNTLDGLINFNQHTEVADLKWNPYQSLSQQIPAVGTSYQVTKSGVVLNEEETLIRTYSVGRQPDQWSLHAMGELIGDPLRDLLQIPCPFLMHYGIHICNQDKTKTRVQSRESWVENQARSKIGKRIPILLKQSRELDFVRHQLSKGERFVQTSFTVTLFAPPSQLAHADQVLTSLFRSKRWQLQGDAYIQLPSFLATLPMMWGGGLHQDLGYLQRLKTTLSTEAANLLPLQGEWKGTQGNVSCPGMLFVGRRGQLFTWSPFDNQEGNYNVAVVGKSGSGKSVFMQELVTSTLGQGGQVFVLDVGRSFERTAKLLDGAYIEFTPRTTLSINPFSTIPTDNGAESEDALAMLKPILSLMAAPKDGTNDLENAFLEQGLKAVWTQLGQAATLSDIAAFLLSHEDTAAQKLGQKLFPYTKGGIYGRFFEGPATVDLSNPMVVIELEELKERKDLQEVIVQMMIVQITNKLYLGDRKTPSHVVLDEAWDMLRGKQSGTFIETAARRLRKYRGSLVVGTQSVNDFYATPAAQVAFENSDWLCLLSQKPESIKQLKSAGRIMMDPGMESLLTSVKTKQGQYAEVMLYGPHGYAIGRLLLDPFSQLLYSTKPEEFAAIQNLLESGISLTDGLESLAQGRRP